MMFETLQSRQLMATNPSISIAANVPTANETGQIAGQFTITRGGDLKSAVTVPIKISGTATNGVDYATINKSIVIAAGAASVSFSVKPVVDSTQEGDETVIASLSLVTGYTRKTSTAQVKLIDSGDSGGGTDTGGQDTPAAANFTWKSVAQPAVGRVEPETATVGSKIYCFSGYQGQYIPGARVDVFDMVTKTWSRKADMPTPLTHSAIAVVGTDIWFAGGYILKPGSTVAQQTYYKGVFRYNTLTDTWSAGPSLPDYRGSAGMVSYNNKLYLFSGDDKNRQVPRTETYVLDLANQSVGWKTLAPIPQGRTHFGIVQLNGFVYIIGGQKLIDETSVHYASSYKYDIANNTWTRIADYPTVISHISPSTFLYHGRIIVAGGETEFNKSSSAVREYNPATNTWRSLTSLPQKRAAGIASMYGTEFFFTGGKDGNFARETWVAQVGLS